LGFLDKFKKKKEENKEIAVPKPEETPSTEDIRTNMNDIPPELNEGNNTNLPAAENIELPPITTEETPEQEPPKKEEETPEQEPPKEEKEQETVEALSLPEFEKADAEKLPEEIPFDEISSGKKSEDETTETEGETPLPETTETREIEDNIFIKVADYKEIMQSITNIKKEVKNSKNSIEDIVKNINFENIEIAKAKESLSSIQKAIIKIDDDLFEK